jgi:predicted small secreted protein
MWVQINLALFSLSVTPGQAEPAKYATYSLLLTTCNVFQLLSINTNCGPNHVPRLRISSSFAKKTMKGFGEQILHTFQALSNCTRIWVFLEKELRFAGFEEPKLQL